MKTIKSKLLPVTLVIVAILAFSSCSEDRRWIATSLNFETDVPIRGNGSFNYTIRVDESYLADFRPGRDELLDINTLNSWLTISQLYTTDRVTLRLIANGDIIYDFYGTISGDKYGEFYIDDRGFKNFMIDAIDIIRRNGFVDITIQGSSDIGDGGPLVFLFENNVDIYISE